MDELENDIERLKKIIEDLLERTKYYSATEFNCNEVPVGTFFKFRQSEGKELFHYQADTLYKIARRIDRLDKQSNTAQSLRKEVTAFKQRWILKEIKRKGNISRINYHTLKKFRSKNSMNSYSINTLITHAEYIQKVSHTHTNTPEKGKDDVNG